MGLGKILASFFSKAVGLDYYRTLCEIRDSVSRRDVGALEAAYCNLTGSRKSSYMHGSCYISDLAEIIESGDLNLFKAAFNFAGKAPHEELWITTLGPPGAFTSRKCLSIYDMAERKGKTDIIKFLNEEAAKGFRPDMGVNKRVACDL